MHNSNSVTDEIAYIYIATDLTEGISQLDESESDLVVKKVPFQEALKMVMNGEITDSMSMAGILKVGLLMKGGF
jgi:ADP-ribose pyrophosphatase